MHTKHKLWIAFVLFFCTLFLLLLAGLRIQKLQAQVNRYAEECADRTDAPGNAEEQQKPIHDLSAIEKQLEEQNRCIEDRIEAKKKGVPLSHARQAQCAAAFKALPIKGATSR